MDILHNIDQTLADYTVSADAMRWAPEGPEPKDEAEYVAYVKARIAADAE